MLKIKYLALIWLFFILATQPTLACTKKMRWDDDYPYTFANEVTPNLVEGISVDITRTILSTLGCNLIFEKMPWARALLALKAGNIDILSGTYKTHERQQYAHFSISAGSTPNLLFVRRNELDLWQFKTLQDITKTSFDLGVQINVSYSKEYEILKEQTNFSKHLHKNTRRESLWQMLKLKRIDGVIADQKTGLIELDKLGLSSKIAASGLVVSNDETYFAFSKISTPPEFVKKFNAAFRKLKHDGTLERINSLYLSRQSF